MTSQPPSATPTWSWQRFVAGTEVGFAESNIESAGCTGAPAGEREGPEEIGRMNQKVKVFALGVLGGMTALSLAGSASLKAQEKDAGRKPQTAEVVLVRSPVSPGQLLPDKLGSSKATSESREFKPDSLAELVGERVAAVREYRVLLAASRSYGTTQIDVFQAEN